MRVAFAIALLVAWIGAWAATDDELAALMQQAMRGDAQAPQLPGLDGAAPRRDD